jgi:hypothetical protein
MRNIIFIFIIISCFLFSTVFARIRYDIKIVVRDVWVCTSSKGLKSCGWHSDCSTLYIYDTELKAVSYNGKVCCNMAQTCYTKDGYYGYYDNRWNDEIWIYRKGKERIRLWHSRAHKTLKEKEVGIKGVKSTGYQYIYESQVHD